jgi:hypothetical protein
MDNQVDMQKFSKWCDRVFVKDYPKMLLIWPDSPFWLRLKDKKLLKEFVKPEYQEEVSEFIRAGKFS